MMTSSNNDKTLVSLCITCYNQAKYIRESIQSAFDQTYSPLEIVVSDDCSTDGTDKIVEEMFSEYHGPHKLIFNRNERNLFVCRNYEKAFKIAHGKLLVTGAGDDISFPHRVQRLVELWNGAGQKPSMLIHGFSIIDLQGIELRQEYQTTPNIFRGAGAAYISDVVTKFPALSVTERVYEDHVFSTRALLLGDCLIVNEALVKYRLGSGLTTAKGHRATRARASKAALPLKDVQLADIEYARSFVAQSRCNELKKIVDFRFRHYSAEYDVCAGRFFWTRFDGWRRLTPENGWQLSLWEKYVIYGRYVPPLGLGVFIWVTVMVLSKLRILRLIKWGYRVVTGRR